MHRLIVALALEDVLGNIDEHRTRAAALGDIESLMQNLRQILELLHQEIVLGGGARDTKGVGFLERVGADQLAGHLAGEGDQRNRIHHGVDQTGDQVGGTRTRGGAADARLASGPRIALGGKSGVRFVAHQDVADGMIVHRVVKGQRDSAGIAEDYFDAFLNQAFKQNFRARHELIGGGGRHTVYPLEQRFVEQ